MELHKSRSAIILPVVRANVTSLIVNRLRYEVHCLNMWHFIVPDERCQEMSTISDPLEFN